MSNYFVKIGTALLAIATFSVQCKEDEFHQGRSGILSEAAKKALTTTKGVSIETALPTIISNSGGTPARLFGQKFNKLDGNLSAENITLTKSGSTKSVEIEYVSLISDTILFGISPAFSNTGYHDANLVVNDSSSSKGSTSLSETVLGTIENAIYVASITAEPKIVSTGLNFDTDQDFKIAAFHSKEKITISGEFTSETGISISSETEIAVAADQRGQMQFVALDQGASSMSGKFSLDGTWTLTDSGSAPGSATYDNSGSATSLTLCNPDLLESFTDAKNIKEIMTLVREHSADISFNLIMANEVDLSKGKIVAKLNANRICQLYPVLIILAEEFKVAQAGIEVDAGIVFIGHGEEAVDLTGVLTSSSPSASTDVHVLTLDLLAD